MEEVTAKTQMEKIRRFEKGFMAIHLINLGEKLGILEALNKNMTMAFWTNFTKCAQGLLT